MVAVSIAMRWVTRTEIVLGSLDDLVERGDPCTFQMFEEQPRPPYGIVIVHTLQQRTVTGAALR